MELEQQLSIDELALGDIDNEDLIEAEGIGARDNKHHVPDPLEPHPSINNDDLHTEMPEKLQDLERKLLAHERSGIPVTPRTKALQWDHRYEEQDHSQVIKGLTQLQAIQIPRWTGQGADNLGCELHGFSDASSRAYAAVAYPRIIQKEGSARVTLLTAKTRVAPILPVTIHRLELRGAQLLAKTLHFLILTMGFESIPLYCHTDASIVLAWLTKHPSTWRTFVSNRMAHIHELVPNAKWRYVPTKDNPADCASRGLFPEELEDNPLWWHGPQWLTKHSASWPESRSVLSQDMDLEWSKKVTYHTMKQAKQPFDQADRFSFWPNLLRVTAYCLRFFTAFMIKVGKLPKTAFQHETLALSSDEIQQAFLYWIRRIQKENFEPELCALQQDNQIKQSSSLKTLYPFLDESGVLRLGGCLDNAPISYDEKHPITVPRHRISELIAHQSHIRSFHGGTQLALRTLRQRFWVLGARTLVKRLIYVCVLCVRQRATLSQQLMGAYHRFTNRRGLPAHMYSDNGTTFQGAERELRNCLLNLRKDLNLQNQLASQGSTWHFIPPSAPHFGGM
ncbi:uncharacterized protein LOC117181223 [Belonocnema kinseyi]|uniref:uncharacterized protein LOC117181223 n=1 Tax=Belonocnema kinseyi TaxID=2817044 RepID=UPI00143DB0E1|nr:uncharacterized protein LOC117181223 [Belonocnema kinseyi]